MLTRNTAPRRRSSSLRRTTLAQKKMGSFRPPPFVVSPPQKARFSFCVGETTNGDSRRTTRGRTEDVGVRRNDAEARSSELARNRYRYELFTKKVRASASSSPQNETSSADNGTDGKTDADRGGIIFRRVATKSDGRATEKRANLSRISGYNYLSFISKNKL